MICEYCIYKNSWDCGDGWNRRENCSSFALNWDSLSKSEQGIIRLMLETRETDNCYHDDSWD